MTESLKVPSGERLAGLIQPSFHTQVFDVPNGPHLLTEQAITIFEDTLGSTSLSSTDVNGKVPSDPII